MKQAMKRKTTRVERTDDVGTEVGYKGDRSLIERVDAILAIVEAVVNGDLRVVQDAAKNDRH